MTAPLQACSISSMAYLAQARVLAKSFFRHHPDASLRVLVIDDLDGELTPGSEPFEVVQPSQLDLDVREYLRMATAYDAFELACALKPWLLEHLLNEGAGEVVYLDGDIEVHAPLDSLAAVAGEHGIALVPHALSPWPQDGQTPLESIVLRSGVFNGGCLAVGEKGRGFLKWWAARLRRDCIIDQANGLFVDQRWLDLVPALFDHGVVRDPGMDVAYWNLFEREVINQDGEYRVNDGPLRFFHFSGFSPEHPDRLSQFAGERSRSPLGGQPAVAAMCRTYVEALGESGYWETSVRPYGYGRTAAGLTLDSRMRRAYRAALVQAEIGGGEVPDHPFDGPGATAFLAWLQTALDPHSRWPISRYLRDLHAGSPELQGRFPDIDGEGRLAFLEWAQGEGAATAEIPEALLPELADRAGEGLEQPGGAPLDDAFVAGERDLPTGRAGPLGAATRAKRQVVRRLVSEQEHRQREINLALLHAVEKINAELQLTVAMTDERTARAERLAGASAEASMRLSEALRRVAADIARLAAEVDEGTG